MGEYEQPTIIASEDQAAATAPVTLAGVLVQQNAEMLSGILISELTHPGTPVLYGTVSRAAEMKTCNVALGG